MDKVSQYIKDKNKWTQELELLRSVLLELPFQEEIKWGSPSYAYKGKNIVGMSAFKNYVGLWFHQGVFLKDTARVLINAQAEKTVAMRQWRFFKIEEIDTHLIKSYLLEAIKNSEEGKEVKIQKNSKPLKIPTELQLVLTNDARLKQKFEAFTLGKKREFTTYIEEAKRAETKKARIEKILPLIQQGIGLHDKYRK